MEIVSLVIGFILGVILVGIVVEIGAKKTASTTPASRPAKEWSISEISNPKIMAEYLSDIDLPKGSKIIVNKYKNKEKLAGLNVREHKGIKGNYIIGDDRALILAGPVKKDEIGFWTVEKEIIEKLNSEFDEMWNEATQLKHEEKTGIKV